jgi:RNA polymerase sigma-70 factor, ECF subfamily
LADTYSHRGIGDDLGLKNLVSASTRGDVDAFGELYRRYAEQVHRYCSYRVATATEAEDLTAEIFLKVWQGIKTYRLGDVPFSAWLYRIAHNHVLNYRKQFRHKYEAADAGLPEEVLQAIRDEVDENNPVESAIRKSRVQNLRQAMALLPEEQQQVLYFRFIEGWSHSEIGAILGKPETTVRGLQFRALQSLGKKLDKEALI